MKFRRKLKTFKFIYLIAADALTTAGLGAGAGFFTTGGKYSGALVATGSFGAGLGVTTGLLEKKIK